MAQPFDPATREALLARVRFYRELGLTELYRRPVDAASIDQLEAISASAEEEPALQDRQQAAHHRHDQAGDDHQRDHDLAHGAAAAPL